MSEILYAAPVVEKKLQELSERCHRLKEQGVTPSMKVILVGENPASVIYTRNKKKFCEKFGAECEIVGLSETISETEFRQKVDAMAADPQVHGCFVQLPLPKQLAHIDVGRLIPPNKDVDGFHPDNIGYLFEGDCGEKALLPCTPKGIITLLDHYGISLEGKEVVIIGRSTIVGKPLALLMTNHNATVTICHSRTKDLETVCHRADIIVSAIGRAKWVGTSFINPDKQQVIVDVGINHDESGKLCGDVDFDAVKDKVAAITPVPKGVGPMTILSLAQNLLQAAEKSLYQ